MSRRSRPPATTTTRSPVLDVSVATIGVRLLVCMGCMASGSAPPQRSSSTLFSTFVPTTTGGGPPEEGAVHLGTRGRTKIAVRPRRQRPAVQFVGPNEGDTTVRTALAGW
mmetsp:Transcript_23703/g.63728  ORF Transcript_23703/g.63728 Transcript_23703/m.63728 type:complete len:110 (-) Transcript_23703:1526-1855(-)